MAEISDESDDDYVAPTRGAKIPPRSVLQNHTVDVVAGKASDFAMQQSAPKLEDQRSSSLRSSAKMSKDEESIENFGLSLVRSTASATHVEEQNLATKRWLMRPCHPSDPPLLCFVERDKGGFGISQPTFRCYLEGRDGTNHRFLMAARKKAGNKTSYYLVSLEMEPDDRGSDAVLGKIRGNTVGSQYLLTDHGLAPDKTETPSTLRKVVTISIMCGNCLILNYLQELGLVRFEFDSGGPSRIEVMLLKCLLLNSLI